MNSIPFLIQAPFFFNLFSHALLTLLTRLVSWTVITVSRGSAFLFVSDGVCFEETG